MAPSKEKMYKIKLKIKVELKKYNAEVSVMVVPLIKIRKNYEDSCPRQ